MSLLDELKQITTVVADSSDTAVVRRFKPKDVTTNPSLILKAAALPRYQSVVEDALEKAHRQGGSLNTRLINAGDHLAVNIGALLLQEIPGRISTEVDARFAWDRGMCIARARKLIRLYQQQGVDRSRVLIKLAATWQGIRAAEQLEQEGINCNLTLLFSFAQARACAEAGVYLVSPFVGRMTDWYMQHSGFNSDDIEQDPGVLTVRKIAAYYQAHQYSTAIMAASFRHQQQVMALAKCCRVTLAPELLQQLSEQQGELIPTADLCEPPCLRPSPLTESEFNWQHCQDAMAVDLLARGIRRFAEDQDKLERLLSDKLRLNQSQVSRQLVE